MSIIAVPSQKGLVLRLFLVCFGKLFSSAASGETGIKHHLSSFQTWF